METARVARVFTILAVTSLAGACGGRADASIGSDAIEQTTLSTSLRSVGVACANDGQCASGACSVDASVAEGCGVCLEIRALGARCDAPLTTCSRSAVCEAAICRTTKQDMGQPCRFGGKGDSRDCDDELRCVGDRESGTCVHRAQLGEACGQGRFDDCAFHAQCERGICVAPRLGALGDTCEARSCGPGLACYRSNDSRTCQAPNVLVENADCGGDRSGSADCAEGMRCELVDAPSPARHFACVAGRPEGAECASNHCAEGLFCGEPEGETTFRCQRLRQEGEACSHPDCSAGLECRGGRCAPACR